LSLAGPTFLLWVGAVTKLSKLLKFTFAAHATPRLSLLDVDLLVPCCIQLIALPA
jgi:hypothetical protein